jgi:hypothetical protein
VHETYRTQVNEVSVYILTLKIPGRTLEIHVVEVKVENGSNKRHSMLNHYSEVLL